jgi:hypothetical protein
MHFHLTLTPPPHPPFTFHTTAHHASYYTHTPHHEHPQLTIPPINTQRFTSDDTHIILNTPSNWHPQLTQLNFAPAHSTPVAPHTPSLSLHPPPYRRSSPSFPYNSKPLPLASMYPNSTWKLDQLNPKNKSLTHTHTRQARPHTLRSTEGLDAQQESALCDAIFFQSSW